MTFPGVRSCALAVLLTTISISSASVATTDLVHVRLKDRLDRSDDGYCLDIVGTSQNLRLDLPLFAHNCKGRATSDSAIVYTSTGQLIFPEPNVCVTVFGINNTVLPGTSVLLRPCDQSTSFFDTTNLQKFDHLRNGQLKLRSSTLCLAVGKMSSVTYSSFDRWRVLSLESCTDLELSLSAWEMVPLI